MSSKRPKRKPFLLSQVVELLTEEHEPLHYLGRQAARPSLLTSTPAAAVPGTTAGGADDDRWREITRAELVAGEVTSEDSQPPISLHRMVMTTDAGIGKSVNLRWLVAKWNESTSDGAAFLIHLDRVASHQHDESFFRDVLIPEFRKAGCAGSDETLAKYCFGSVARTYCCSLWTDSISRVRRGSGH